MLLSWVFISTGTLDLSAVQGGAADGEWSVYGGDAGATRYAPLGQIHAGNVQELEIAWRWSSANHGPRVLTEWQASPLVINGVIYTTAGSRRNAVAIDATTGETLWMWRMDEGPRAEGVPAIGRNAGRGVAYWSDGDRDERILVATPSYQLVALDARTGRPVATFGDDGVIDMVQNLRPREGVEPIGRVGNTSPPVVVGDIVVVGPNFHTGGTPVPGDPWPRNAPGDIVGYDVRSGEPLWRFHTIPEPGEYGVETWEGGSWEYTGNVGVWAPISADEELGILYLPVEAATNDLYGGQRLGDNLFSTSLVALDAATGERLWHYQLVRHDIWDYDTPAAPILVNIEVAGEPIRAVVQVTKQGFAYVFDRESGEPVWPFEYRAVPESDVPGEVASPLQPFPTRPPPFERQGIGEEDLIDFTPELRAEALRIVADYRVGPLFTPPSLRFASDGTIGTLMLPGMGGGANWPGGAVDVETGVLYVASATDASLLQLVEGAGEHGPHYHAGSRAAPRVRGLPLVKPPYGRITAIDLNRGETLWWVPNAGTPPSIRNHPDLEGVEVGRTGRATRGPGLLVTATLLFGGEGPQGEPIFRAYDKSTGTIVHELELPATTTGHPVTYMSEGRQYLLMAVGGPGIPAELVALKLPDDGLGGD